jgi:hypothetical protein
LPGSASAAAAGTSSPLLTPGLVMPYDYGARFPLRGILGNTLEDVINISPEGAFIATAIGYGFHENRGQSLVLTKRTPDGDGLRVNLDDAFRPGDIVLENIPAVALLEGFRINPEFVPMVFKTEAPEGGTIPLRDEFIPKEFSDRIIQKLRPPEDIHFYFTLIDSGTGRELQDVPSHSLASLGKSNGERPFRPLARPVAFMPRTTVRVQVTEATEGARGDLYIVLFGYKVLGVSGCPEPAVRAMAEAAMRLQPPAPPSEAVVPFDYVATLNLSGVAGTFVEDEVPINVDGAFLATGIGYGLLPDDFRARFLIEEISKIQPEAKREKLFPKVTIGTEEIEPTDPRWEREATVADLGKIPLRLFPSAALRQGVAVRPNFLRLAFQDNGVLSTNLSFQIANMLFERRNRPEDVSFLYSIFDAGTGREMQNTYLNNIAGLGIGNGDRPFKTFARPMHFQARSTIRISLLENQGQGRLHFVLHGFKVLGSRTTGAGR